MKWGETMISVVVPVYNQKRQLQLTLDFFSRQIVDESFELIVVDDCSDAVSYTHLTLPTT